MTTKKLIRIEFANRCAWRAIYVYWRQRVVFHLGVDPHHGVKPRMFGGVHVFLHHPWRFHVTLPYVPWLFVVRCRYARPVRWLYRLSAAFWHRVDGRYRPHRPPQTARSS